MFSNCVSCGPEGVCAFIQVFSLMSQIGHAQSSTSVAAISGGKNSTCNIHESGSVHRVFAPSQADLQI